MLPSLVPPTQQSETEEALSYNGSCLKRPLPQVGGEDDDLDSH